MMDLRNKSRFGMVSDFLEEVGVLLRARRHVYNLSTRQMAISLTIG